MNFQKYNIFKLQNHWASPYILIAFFLLLANWQQIFNIDYLIADDSFMLRDALTNYHWAKLQEVFNQDFWFTWPSLVSHIRRTLFWELCEYSLRCARIVLFFGCYIPLSCLFFYFFRKYLNMSYAISLGVSLLPGMCPLRTGLPAGLNASYQTFGLLLALISLIILIQYLQKGKTSSLLFALMFYFIAIQTMEQAVFLLPPFCLIALYCLPEYERKSLQRFLLIFCSYTAIALYRVILSVAVPRAAATVTKISMEERYSRVHEAFAVADPLVSVLQPIRGLYYILLGGVFLAILSYALRDVIVKLKASRTIFCKDVLTSNFILLVTAFCWFVCSSFVFILVSRDTGGRYYHIASFAYSAFFLVVIFNCFKKLFAEKFFFVFLLLFLFSIGLISFHRSVKSQKMENEVYNLVKRTLQQKDFPENSQVVIIGTHGLGYGLWPRTDGITKSITGRMDITGIMPMEYHFYNPFNGYYGRSWDTKLRMSGLLLSQPVFIFRYQYCEESGRSVMPVSYGLQWFENEKWALHHFDINNGNHQVIACGKGREQYLIEIDKLIQKHGISLADIAWGGYNLYTK